MRLFFISAPGANLIASSRIIILNGASSAGKTSIARALQNTLEQPFLYVSFDAFLSMLPARYAAVAGYPDEVPPQGLTFPPRTDEHGTYLDTQLGAFGQRLIMDGMVSTLATLAGQGFNLIVDTLLLYPAWVTTHVLLLSAYEVWLIGVVCPLDVLEQRESSRGDRNIGLARGQVQRVHAHGIDDLTVDTSLLTPQQAADRIIATLQTPPTAFAQLRAALL